MKNDSLNLYCTFLQGQDHSLVLVLPYITLELDNETRTSVNIY